MTTYRQRSSLSRLWGERHIIMPFSIETMEVIIKNIFKKEIVICDNIFIVCTSVAQRILSSF